MGNYKDKNGTTRVGDFLRKIKGVAPEILDVVGSISGISQLNNLAELIGDTDTITPEDKEMALKLLDFDLLEAQEVTKRWSSDMVSDSWLSKNVRPLIVLYLTVVLSFYIIADSCLNGFTVKTAWITLLTQLLMLVYAAYFGSRGLEKITKIKR